MKCSVCGGKPTMPFLVRWRVQYPDDEVTSVVIVHRKCDSHPWPAEGYGHLDVRALTAKWVEEFMGRRAWRLGDATRSMLLGAFERWGTKVDTPAVYDLDVTDQETWDAFVALSYPPEEPTCPR